MAKNISNYNDEDLRRIEKERLEINAAYDNGYSADLNESKSSNDYHDRIDRYGFIHNTKLPSELTDVELKRNNIEKLRETKWQAMFKEWNKHYAPSKQKYSDKLVTRIFKGIPNSMRNSAWYKLLDIQSQIDAQKGVYEKMRDLARKYSLDLRQIDMDINRTFRNNEVFKKRYCARQKQLYNILAAYSIYNTEIGYCQGMSTLTAFLLMYLSDEERTFWALSQLMSNVKYSMHGFFISGFPKLIRYSDKHEMIIKQLLPKIHKKLIKCNITPLIYTTKWFLQCYLDALPFSLVLRFWDVYLLKGDIAMLAMSYCILKMHKKTLLQKNFDMDKINDFLNHKIPDNFYYDDDIVIEKLNKCIDKLSQYKFPSGPLLEAIPQAELPKIPFGDFKKIDKQDMIAQLVLKSVENQDKDRDVVVSKLAKEKLETEQRKREERRRKRQERLLANGDTNGIDRHLNDGKPIKNISDEDSDDDSEYGQDDDSDDDLNPSKISEYDDEKYEKESMISNLTHESLSKNHSGTPTKSSQLSLNKNKIHKLNKQSDTNINNGTNNSNKSNSSKNLTLAVNYVEDELNRNKNLIKSANNLYNKSDSNDNLKIHTPISSHIASVSVSSIHTTSPIPKKTHIPSSQSYVTSIISNPPPQSPSFYEAKNEYIASIKSNYTNSRTPTNNKYEYVRSPHGIYTRINVPPDANSFNYSRRSPVSGRLISDHVYTQMQRQQSLGAAGSSNQDSLYNIPVNNKTTSTSRLIQASKRTSSLRSIQKHTDLINSGSNITSNSKYGHINSSSNLIRTNTPTKQQLQNHSARIASIQQHHHETLNGNNNSTLSSNYSNIAIISQTPKSQINYLNQYINSMQLNSSSLHQQLDKPKSPPAHRSPSGTGNNQIEQYDYI